MKRFIIFVALFASAIGGGIAMQSLAHAQAAPMTETHIERIRSNCVEAQSTLTQLHASDAGLRVNRGQLYELISTKLMAPFNSRVALNRLNGASLVTVATSYESQLAAFRTLYQQYEEAMSGTLRINCKNQPVAFYDSVNDTRTKRKKVNESTLLLQQTVEQYKAEFEKFAKTIPESKS